MVACGTERGNEVLAHAAAALDAPFVANCLAVETGDTWTTTRVQWGGSLNEDARLTSSMPILSVAPHAVEAGSPTERATAVVRPLDVALPDTVTTTMIQDRIVLSEGVTLATAVVSVLTGRPVRGDLAMTGEITLRGRVLAIGGIKEKLLAALRGGITKVLIPDENVKDLAEIPDNVKEGLEIVPVAHVDEVLEHALIDRPSPIEWTEADDLASQPGAAGASGGEAPTAH